MQGIEGMPTRASVLHPRIEKVPVAGNYLLTNLSTERQIQARYC
jgi:hypothetical protein